jgi:uncharacterized MAPEG superfamily protein
MANKKGKDDKHHNHNQNNAAVNDQAEPEEHQSHQDGKYISTSYTIFNFAIVPIFLFGAYVILKFILNSQYSSLPFAGVVDSVFQVKDWSFEGKVKFVALVFGLNSLFLFAITLMIVLFRILLNKANPQAEQDPIIITTLNRVLQHTIEQSFIFFPLFAHFVLTSKPTESRDAVNYALIYLVGRVIYLVGYLINLVIKIFGFRAMGFLVNVGVSIILIVRLTGCSHFYNTVMAVFA